MPEKISLTVALTKQDMKQCFFAVNKALVILSVVVAGLLLLVNIFHLITSVAFLSFSLFTTALFALVFLLLAAMMFLSFYMRYKRFVGDFEKKSHDKTMVFELDRQGFTMTEAHGRMTMGWGDIARIIEYPPMYLIIQSVGKIAVIPKRSFRGPDEQSAFIAIITAGVDARKLKLKNYPFRAYAPVPSREVHEPAGEGKAAEPRNTQEPPLIELEVVMTGRDYLKYNFYNYYTKPAGPAVTVLGLIIMAAVIWAYSSGEIYLSRFTAILLAVLGAWFALGAPLLLLVQGIRVYKSDATIRDAVTTYRFYGGHMSVDNVKGMNTWRFGEFRRLVRAKAFYLFYITRNMAYVIPRRCIPDGAAFDRNFESMKAENERLRNAPAYPAPPVMDRFCDRCGAPRQAPGHMFCIVCGKRFDERHQDSL